jgi:hypothetical protein
MSGSIKNISKLLIIRRTVINVSECGVKLKFSTNACKRHFPTILVASGNFDIGPVRCKTQFTLKPDISFMIIM